MDGPFLLIVAAMLTLSCEVQPCSHTNSTLCSLCYWLAPLVTGPFLACSACYWPVTGLFRLLLACSLLVSLVTGLFRLFCVLVTSVFCADCGGWGESTLKLLLKIHQNLCNRTTYQCFVCFSIKHKAPFSNNTFIL